MCPADKIWNWDSSPIDGYAMRGLESYQTCRSEGGGGSTVSLREGQRLEDTPLPPNKNGESGVLWNRVSSRLRNPCGFRTIHLTLPSIGGLRSSGKSNR